MPKFAVVITDRLTEKSYVHDYFPSRALANEAAYHLDMQNYGTVKIDVVAEKTKAAPRKKNPAPRKCGATVQVMKKGYAPFSKTCGKPAIGKASDGTLVCDYHKFMLEYNGGSVTNFRKQNPTANRAMTDLDLMQIIESGRTIGIYPRRGELVIDGFKRFKVSPRLISLAQFYAKRKKNPLPDAHVTELIAAYEYGGMSKAREVAAQIVRDNKLKVWEAAALSDKFHAARKLIDDAGMTAAIERDKSFARHNNPVPLSRKAQISAAGKLYSEFTGHEAGEVTSVDKPVMPDVMLAIGEIDGVMYSTVRDGVPEKYIHKFKKSCRPVFAVSHDGKQLFMLGGAYDFTERGIIDKS